MGCAVGTAWSFLPDRPAIAAAAAGCGRCGTAADVGWLSPSTAANDPPIGAATARASTSNAGSVTVTAVQLRSRARDTSVRGGTSSSSSHPLGKDALFLCRSHTVAPMHGCHEHKSKSVCGVGVLLNRGIDGKQPLGLW